MVRNWKSIEIKINYDDNSQDIFNYPLEKLRNGENPHQNGYAGQTGYTILTPGRGMSYTNHLDLYAYATAFEMAQTMKLLNDPRENAVVINKHTIPAVFAVDKHQKTALEKSLKFDPKSPFGGIMCTNRPLLLETAQFLKKLRKEQMFTLDVLACPGFEPGSIELLTEEGTEKERMYNLRVIDVSNLDTFEKINSGINNFNITFSIGGNPVITEMDRISFFNTEYKMEILSKKEPTRDQLVDAYLAWIGTKYIKSNSFSFIKDGALIAQCGGQTNREDSAKFALQRAKEFGNDLKGSMSATDSFLFNRDCVDILNEYGVNGVVQPTRKNLTTGSLKPDELILDKINEYNMIMIRPELISADECKPWRVFRHT